MQKMQRLPLTLAQHGIWLGQQLQRTSPIYNAAEYIEFDAGTDLTRLRLAIAQATQEAEALHVHFEAAADDVEQILGVRAAGSVTTVYLESSAASPDVALHWMEKATAQAFDLERGPVFRQAVIVVSSGAIFWYLCAHHIALDGFGFSLVFGRAAALYSAAVAGSLAPAPSVHDLASVIACDASYGRSAQRDADRQFWHARFADHAPAASFTQKSALVSISQSRRTLIVAPALRDALLASARSVGGTWAEAMIAAVAMLLASRNDSTEVVLGLPMMGRTDSVQLRVPSMVMNIVPLQLRVREEAQGLTVMAEVVRELRALRPHARYRYEDLRRELKRLSSQKRLFGPVVNIMPFAHGFRFGDTTVASHTLTAGPVEDISFGVQALSRELGLRIRIDAHPDLYNASDLERIAGDLLAILEQIANSKGPSMLSGQSIQETLQSEFLDPHRIGCPTRDVAPEHVIARFQRQSVLRASHTALVDGHAQISYADLARSSRNLAAELSIRGVGRGHLVAIVLPRSHHAVTAILAILMCGGAYLPLDPDGPRERMRAILADAAPTLVVTNRLSSERAYTELAHLPQLLLDESTSGQACHGGPHTLASDTAYVIYTSGSTGRPNGVVVSHGALAHFVSAASERYGVTESARVLQFAPLHFDASVEEIFLTLCAGATLVLRSDAMVQSMQELLRGCFEQKISVLDLPTAVWHELAFAVARGGLSLPPTLQTLIIGGEAALPERVARWLADVGPVPALINTYGPTESTVVALSAMLSEPQAPSPRRAHAFAPTELVPIGAPLRGVAAVVLDARRRPVASGNTGELYLMGPTLATGYLNREELEEERFVMLPFERGPVRAYRTLDLVRALPDGKLTFVGRVDDELKISGCRIDPREVENALACHHGVREVAVVSSLAGGGGAVLVAHVVSTDTTLESVELRRYAAEHVLAAAVPSLFVMHAQLPRTRNGKVDRRVLSELAITPPTEAAQLAMPPRTELERCLHDVFCDVLQTTQLSIDSDVFELGVQSLQAIQIASRLTATLHEDVAAALLFQHPSVSRLASALARGTQPATSDVPSDGFEIIAEDLALAASLPAYTVPGARRGRVLLTGATGFVGAHLLVELLNSTADRVACLVRAQDGAAAALRLRKTLAAYALSDRLPNAAWERVDVIAGDLGASGLGLSADAFEKLADSVDSVYHSGASVSLARGYGSMRTTNVLGTHALLRLALSGSATAFHHISTIATAARDDVGALHEEFGPFHSGLKDGYTQSKWLAEQLVLAGEQRGLRVTVSRLGRVTGSTATAQPNPDDIVWRLLRAGIPAGILPELPVEEPWTPVDFVVRAIAAQARTSSSDARLLHLTPTAPIRLREAFAWVRSYGYPISYCSLASFRERLSSTADHHVSTTLAFLTLAGAREAHAGPQPPTFPRSERARRILSELSVHAPEVDCALMHRYLATAARDGILPPPPASTSATRMEADAAHRQSADSG